jgi:hypothetical protein
MWPMGRRAALPAILGIVEDLGLTVGTIHGSTRGWRVWLLAIPSPAANRTPLGSWLVKYTPPGARRSRTVSAAIEGGELVVRLPVSAIVDAWPFGKPLPYRQIDPGLHFRLEPLLFRVSLADLKAKRGLSVRNHRRGYRR